MKKKYQDIKTQLDDKLTKRLKIYFFISLCMIGITIYEVIISGISPLIAIGVFLLGSIIGFFVSRMFYIFWDQKLQKVSSRIDWFGGAILGIYIIFSIFRHRIIARYFQPSFITVVTFAMIGGIMIGRLVGMKSKITQILKGKEELSE